MGVGVRPPAPWFTFAPGVEVRYLPCAQPRLLPRSDVTVLTAWQTARAIPGQTARTGPLVQLVWDYERWISLPEERGDMTRWLSRPGIARVAMSSAVAEMLSELGGTCDYRLSVGLDTKRFRITTPPERRLPVVGFPLRHQPHKAMSDLFAAIPMVRAAVPSVRFRCFGDAMVLSPPDVERLGHLDDQALADFYNECAAFVLPSHAEGLGLPALEAMACGAAVAVTDNGGSRDFCIHERTALVFPPHDPHALAAALIRLISRPRHRLVLARAGAATAASMSWEVSTNAFLDIIDHVVTGNMSAAQHGDVHPARRGSPLPP